MKIAKRRKIDFMIFAKIAVGIDLNAHTHTAFAKYGTCGVCLEWEFNKF